METNSIQKAFSKAFYGPGPETKRHKCCLLGARLKGELNKTCPEEAAIFCIRRRSGAAVKSMGRLGGSVD